MATVLIHADLYLGHRHLSDAYLRFDKKVQAVGQMATLEYLADDEVVDVTGKIVVPGFIDVHCHGGYGIDTMDADSYKIATMAQKMLTEGTTSLLPTTITQSSEHLLAALRAVAVAHKTTPQIVGIHMEGPFIDCEYMGAQPSEYIVSPSVTQLKKYIAAANGLVKFISYAPENPGAHQMEEFCLQNGIIPSIGHTKAKACDVHASKATHVTHLFNAQRGIHHREPGVAGAALLSDNIYCELIADGHHVCPEMIRLAYRLKNANRLILITDAMRAKGMPEGKSELGRQTVWVKDGQARLGNGALAGSVLKMKTAFKNIVDFTHCSIAEAVLMSSTNAATQLKLSHKGQLEVGCDADINVFDATLQLQATYSLGQLVSPKEG